MAGAAFIAITATIIPARIDLNKLVLIYIIIIQAQTKIKPVSLASRIS